MKADCKACKAICQAGLLGKVFTWNLCETPYVPSAKPPWASRTSRGSGSSVLSGEVKARGRGRQSSAAASVSVIRARPSAVLTIAHHHHHQQHPHQQREVGIVAAHVAGMRAGTGAAGGESWMMHYIPDIVGVWIALNQPKPLLIAVAAGSSSGRSKQQAPQVVSPKMRIM